MVNTTKHVCPLYHARAVIELSRLHARIARINKTTVHWRSDLNLCCVVKIYEKFVLFFHLTLIHLRTRICLRDFFDFPVFVTYSPGEISSVNTIQLYWPKKNPKKSGVREKAHAYCVVSRYFRICLRKLCGQILCDNETKITYNFFF